MHRLTMAVKPAAAEQAAVHDRAENAGFNQNGDRGEIARTAEISAPFLTQPP